MEEMKGKKCHQGTAVIVTRPIGNGIALSWQIIKLLGVQIPTDGPIAGTKKFPKVQFGSQRNLKTSWPLHSGFVFSDEDTVPDIGTSSNLMMKC